MLAVISVDTQTIGGENGYFNDVVLIKFYFLCLVLSKYVIFILA